MTKQVKHIRRSKYGRKFTAGTKIEIEEPKEEEFKPIFGQEKIEDKKNDLEEDMENATDEEEKQKDSDGEEK